MNEKLAVFVGGALEFVPNVPLPNTLLLLLLLLCDVLAPLPNVKSGFAAAAAPAAFVFAEKLNPPPAGCCCCCCCDDDDDDDEPNVNSDGFDAALGVSLGLVVENIVGVVAVPPKVAVLLLPKADALDDPKSEEVAPGAVPKFGRGFAVCAGVLNPGSFVSDVPKIDGLFSPLLLPNVGILLSAMGKPDDGLLTAVKADGLSMLKAVVVFDSLLLNNDVELETIGKTVPVGVALVAGLLGWLSGSLFTPNSFVGSAADDVWPKAGIAAGWDAAFESENVKED